MSDYTDISFHLEKAKEELLKANELIKGCSNLAKQTNKGRAWVFEENINSTIRSIEREIEQSEEYTDLIEQGIKE